MTVPAMVGELRTMRMVNVVPAAPETPMVPDRSTTGLGTFCVSRPMPPNRSGFVSSVDMGVFGAPNRLEFIDVCRSRNLGMRIHLLPCRVAPFYEKALSESLDKPPAPSVDFSARRGPDGLPLPRIGWKERCDETCGEETDDHRNLQQGPDRRAAEQNQSVLQPARRGVRPVPDGAAFRLPGGARPGHPPPLP